MYLTYACLLYLVAAGFKPETIVMDVPSFKLIFQGWRIARHDMVHMWKGERGGS